ncbi:MAG TPA: hypothetical protein VFC58_13975 [Desulfosporosinus sp.]|nr:hypothetical protein [Desulfosporosinus sp.]
MGNPIQFDYTMLFSTVLFSLVPLGIFAFAAYILVRFLKRKAINDKELLQKMDELIKLQKQSDKTS